MSNILLKHKTGTIQYSSDMYGTRTEIGKFSFVKAKDNPNNTGAFFEAKIDLSDSTGIVPVTAKTATEFKKIILDLYTEYLNEDVEVTNLMSGKPTHIKRRYVGSCCDPSTERYWCM